MPPSDRRTPLRRIARAIAMLLALGVAAGAVLLLHAHIQIRGIDPDLPSLEAVRAQADLGELPIRVSTWNTASQVTPRKQVLEASLDPDPQAPYVMSHAVFLLEWADGRALLVDAGMDREQAQSFGRPIEWVGGAPIVPHGGIAERLGSALAGRPLAIAFTHLHSDHVGGVVSLCGALPGGTRIRVFQTPAQTDLVNFTTYPGRAALDRAGCLVRERLPDVSLAALPGYPGAFVIRAAGHTPGSQMVGAWVRESSGVRGFLFAGDAANAIDGVRRDVPKPRAYRFFVVPESEHRQTRMRGFLREAEQAGIVVALAHDERHLATTGIPVFGD
ncbi:MAG: metallo-beta-lactamase superfamily protein [Deltaproteobacteria bacterium]|nr:metallo-beta-lactamase superfamily protein [Deltaproteobacteria bacterium]